MAFKAIVCGTTFGQAYLDVIRSTDEVELVGILAKGSERSIQCSELYEVPLYTDLRDIPEYVDIAFVAVKSSVLGGKGTEISSELLKRGINVMQEHPVNSSEMLQCYKLAKKHNVYYRIGNLYPNLESVETFVKAAEILNKNEKLLYGSVLASSQATYLLASILARAIDNFSLYNVSSYPCTEKLAFDNILLSDRDSNIFLQIHNEVMDEDGNNHMHLLSRIILFFESGRLELNDVFGSVVWRSRMNISDMHVFGNQTVEDLTGRSLNICIYNESNGLYLDLVKKIFPLAIGKDIRNFIKEIRLDHMDSYSAQRELLISRRWSEISEAIGFPRVVNIAYDYRDYSAEFEELGYKR